MRSTVKSFSDTEVRAAVELAELIDAVDLAFQDWGTGAARQLVRAGYLADGGAAHHAMAAVVPQWDLAVAKWASYLPPDANRGSESHSTMLASQASTGRPLAAISSMAATLLRTAATTAAVVRRARPNSRRLCLLGFGAVNREVLQGLVAVLPELAQVRVITKPGELAVDICHDGVEISTGHDIAGGLADAELVVSATGSAHALAGLDSVAPGALVVALDGRVVWGDPSGAGVLSDHDAIDSPSLARAFTEPMAWSEIGFIDLSGSALADAALCKVLLAGQR